MPLPFLVLAALLVPADTDQGRRDRALDLLAGEGGRARLVAEAASGPAAARRAALETLGAVRAADAPPGTLEAALRALASADPLLRRAALPVLLAAGEPARAALERLEKGPAEGLPAVPAARARDARFDLRRASVEREFLSLWVPDDGSFHGMFADLRAHGPFGARVLAAIATDRRMAAGDVLGFGPYAWLVPEAAGRERSDCRYRALDALADAGDADAREMLRPWLRKRRMPDGFLEDNPASELYDDFDEDPIPARLDDALREAIAFLGDPNPLWAVVKASEQRDHFSRDRLIEMRRQAGAYASLAAASPDAKNRLERLAIAERLQRECLRAKVRMGMAVDGVDRYNLACLLARRDGPGDRTAALAELELAVQSYAVSARWLERDGDLAALHGEPKFRALVERFRAREKALLEGK